MLLAKLRKSSTLKEQVARSDRLDDEHAGHSCTWLSRITDKLIEGERRRENVDAHIFKQEDDQNRAIQALQ